MASFNNKNDLLKAIKNVVLNSAKEVAPKHTEILKKNTDEYVYNAGSPSLYDRTYELRESATTDVRQENDKIVMTTYNDSDKMSSDYSHPHAYSFGDYNPKDYRPYLVETIVEGTSGDIFGKEGFWHEKRDFITPAREEIEDTVVNNLKNELKKKGLNVK